MKHLSVRHQPCRHCVFPRRRISERIMEHIVDGLVPQASEEVLAVAVVLSTCWSFSDGRSRCCHEGSRCSTESSQVPFFTWVVVSLSAEQFVSCGATDPSCSLCLFLVVLLPRQRDVQVREFILLRNQKHSSSRLHLFLYQVRMTAELMCLSPSTSQEEGRSSKCTQTEMY